MASVMASRFSVLKIEDDSDQEREKAAKKAEEDKNKKKQPKKKRNKANKPDVSDAELQAMAFGLPRPKNNASKQKRAPDSPKKTQEPDWNEWERRDRVLADDAFERDLEQAMMMSKVDYERQASRTSAEPDAPADHIKSKPKKAKPNNTVSVDQLQTLSTSQIDSRDFAHLQPPPPSRPPLLPEGARTEGGGGGDFFEEVERKAKEALRRERVIAEIKQNGPVSVSDGSAPAGDVSSDAPLQLALKDSQLDELQQELEKTREELKLAKSRTRRVLSVLSQSETKEKVQLIVDLEKATAAREAAERERAEMSQQVTSLLAQLEQERSKVHALTTQLKKTLSSKRRGHSETADNSESAE